MKGVNTAELIKACDTVAKRCTRIAGTNHGSAWLFDKLMRWFESSNCKAVTIPVFINEPVMSEGEAEIGRDGSLVMRTVK